MNKYGIIIKTKPHIKRFLPADCTGHDWQHAERVMKMAFKIAAKEAKPVNKLVIALAALLHDLEDWKFDSSNKIKTGKVRKWLVKLKLDPIIIAHVCTIIREMPFKGARVKNKMTTWEGKIVQDADRLDAVGAIGIARAFAYGGFKRRLIYNHRVNHKLHKTFTAYKKSNSSTINHFYEKLLLLKNRMNTKEARAIAKQRHKFMLDFLRQFFIDLA